MRGHGIAVSAVVSVLVLLSVSGPTDAVWDTILPALTAQLTTLWQNNELEFMGSTCFYSQRPTFYRWELYFIGSFTCPTWTRIRGQAKTRSRSGVMGLAIEDFLHKAKNAGLVTEAEALNWLEGYN